MLAEFPEMPATVIAERIEWPHGMILKDRVRELRPLFMPPDPAQRTSCRPGELAQWDLWQPDALIPLGFGQSEKLWVVTGVSGFSRMLGAWMIPTRTAADVTAGMLQVLAQFGAVPRLGVWDQEGCIGKWRHGQQRLRRVVDVLPPAERLVVAQLEHEVEVRLQAAEAVGEHAVLEKSLDD